MTKILKQADSLLKDIEHNISLLANASAFLNEVISDINWVGFYLFEFGKLHLGPFQGKVACTPIEIANGVCGHAFRESKITNVPDVTKFPGHIVCDSASKSEIVIPLIKNGIVFGVLDVDSPLLNRFDEKTTNLIVSLSKIILKYYNLWFDKWNINDIIN